MAKVNLSDKLRISGRDLSDLSEMRIPAFLMLTSVVLVACFTWFFTIIVMKTVLTCNHYLFHLITNSTSDNRTVGIFLGVIVFFACVRALLYQIPWFKDASGDGASQALANFQHTYEHQRSVKKTLQNTFAQGTITLACKRVLITVMTLGAGGSGGLEGPAIPVGGHIGSFVAKLYSAKDVVWLRILQMCGISAAITTLLHAPLTGAIFALELVFGCKFVYRLLTYSLISSLFAFILSNHLMEAEMLFYIPNHPLKYTPSEYLMVVLVTVFASIPSGVGLILIFHFVRRLFSHVHNFFHAPVGAFLCAVTAIAAWHTFDIHPEHILGVGEETIAMLFSSNPHHIDPILQYWPMLFFIVILKLFLTAFTIISGGSAGLLIPAVYVGALSSSGLFHIFSSLDLLPVADNLHHLFMISGIASSLICVMDLPIATVIFVGELFGMSFIAPAILAVALSRVISESIKKHIPQH